MSSGMGLYGHTSECFKPYEEFAICMVKINIICFMLLSSGHC